MPNPAVAALITRGLTEGLTHPGGDGQPPHPLINSQYRTAGMAPEQAEPIITAAKETGEALVHLIENDGPGRTILENPDLEKLRAAAADAPADNGHRQLSFRTTCCGATAFGGLFNLADPQIDITQLQTALNALPATTAACRHGQRR